MFFFDLVAGFGSYSIPVKNSMYPHMVPSIISVITALCVTWLMCLLSPKIGFTDHPADHKHHTAPTPLLGGVGIYLGFLAGVSALYFFTHALPPLTLLLLAVTTAAFLVGIIDDYFALPPLPKACGLCLPPAVAMTVWLWQGGSLITAISCAAAVLFFTNSVNLFDNADGTCAATVSAVMIVTSMLTREPLTLIAAMAILGFFVWNIPPARIFMGDTGSLILGTWCALLCAVHPVVRNYEVRLALWPVLWLFFYDTFSVIIIRIIQNRSIIIGGKDHFIHRLHNYDVPARILVLLCIAATAFPAVLIYYVSTTMIILVGLLLCVITGIVEYIFSSQKYKRSLP